MFEVKSVWPRDDIGIHARSESFRPDVEDQDTVVGAVGGEQPLVRIVDRQADPPSHVVGGESAGLRARVGLAQHRDHGRSGPDAVGVDVKNHDLLAGVNAAPAGAVDGEQSLIHVIDRHRAGELDLAFRPLTGGRTARVSSGLAQNVFHGGACQSPVVIEIEYFDAAVAITREEKSIMDAIQRPLGRSPHAVAGGAAVGHASDEGRVAVQVFLAEQVACGLPVSLRLRGGGNKDNTGQKDDTNPLSFGHGNKPPVGSVPIRNPFSCSTHGTSLS